VVVEAVYAVVAVRTVLAPSRPLNVASGAVLWNLPVGGLRLVVIEVRLAFSLVKVARPSFGKSAD